MKTIIFFDKYTFPEAEITRVRQKSAFLAKNLVPSVLRG